MKVESYIVALRRKIFRKISALPIQFNCCDFDH